MAKQTTWTRLWNHWVCFCYFSYLIYGILMMINKCMLSCCWCNWAFFKVLLLFRSLMFHLRPTWALHFNSTYILLSKWTDLCSVGTLEACVPCLFNWFLSRGNYDFFTQWEENSCNALAHVKTLPRLSWEVAIAQQPVQLWKLLRYEMMPFRHNEK